MTTLKAFRAGKAAAEEEKRRIQKWGNEDTPPGEDGFECYCDVQCRTEDWPTHAAVCFKTRGNSLFKDGNIREAAKLYTKGSEAARRQLDAMTADAEGLSAVKELLVLNLSNLAQCYILQKDWRGAMHAADAALDVDGRHAKSEHRLAQARDELTKELHQFGKKSHWNPKHPTRRLCQRIVDSYRIALEDEYAGSGDVPDGSLYAGHEKPLRNFIEFVKRAKRKDILPCWWDKGATQKLYQVALEDKFHSICFAVQANDLLDHYQTLEGVDPMKELAAVRNIGAIVGVYDDEDSLDEDGEFDEEDSWDEDGGFDAEESESDSFDEDEDDEEEDDDDDDFSGSGESGEDETGEGGQVALPRREPMAIAADVCGSSGWWSFDASHPKEVTDYRRISVGTWADYGPWKDVSRLHLKIGGTYSVKGIAQSFPSLAALVVDDSDECDRISYTIKDISGLKSSLTHLELRLSGQWMAEGADVLAPIALLENLKKLKIDQLRDGSVEDLKHLEKLRSLEQLWYSGGNMHWWSPKEARKTANRPFLTLNLSSLNHLHSIVLLGTTFCSPSENRTDCQALAPPPNLRQLTNAARGPNPPPVSAALHQTLVSAGVIVSLQLLTSATVSRQIFADLEQAGAWFESPSPT